LRPRLSLSFKVVNLDGHYCPDRARQTGLAWPDNVEQYDLRQSVAWHAQNRCAAFDQSGLLLFPPGSFLFGRVSRG
jgi:hypothetical protein